MPIAVGSTAPDFSLKSKNAEGLADVKLSDNPDGKATVLLFFPLAFTGVCTQEFCDITAGLSAYEELNARVIGISVDSPFAQEAWAQANNISITLASDLNKEVTQAYDVLFPNLAEVGDLGPGGLCNRSRWSGEVCRADCDSARAPELRRRQGRVGKLSVRCALRFGSTG
jgi:peroxiredoxin